jgi:hypothetical protein
MYIGINYAKLRIIITFLYLQKSTLTSPTEGCSSVGIVRSRTKATELLLLLRIIKLGNY